jgi:hypothetical protein
MLFAAQRNRTPLSARSDAGACHAAHCRRDPEFSLVATAAIMGFAANGDRHSMPTTIDSPRRL